MNRFVAALPGIIISASIVACAVKSGPESSNSSSNAITGSPALIRTCAAAATYSADGPNDFDTPASANVPASIRTDTDVVHFKAPIVGDVYASGGTDTEGATYLYDLNGRELAHGYSNGDYMIWFDANDVSLDCSSTPYNVHSASSSSSGWSSSGSTSGNNSSSGWSSSSGATGWVDASAPDQPDSGDWSCPGCVIGEDGGVIGNQH